jgi:methylenetetrahydrofolate--tRNA-(uracil-5-)-methyltransferase
MESTAMGLLAGINAYRTLQGISPVVPPRTTAMGGLIHHITQDPAGLFQPMNINFGLFPPSEGRGRNKRQLLSRRALEDAKNWKEEHQL